MRWIPLAAAAALLSAALPAAAQSAASCSADAQTGECSVLRQALASAAPEVGISAAGGSVIPGAEGTRGLTLGLIPRTTASVRVNAAFVHLPDFTFPQDQKRIVTFALKLNTSTRLVSGTPTGLGSLDLLLEAGVLPSSAATGKVAGVLGGGARLGVRRETFATPGVALSGMYRHTTSLRYGGGNQVDYQVNDLSARLTAGKRVGPVGLLGGVGFDRFATSNGSITWGENVAAGNPGGTVRADFTSSRWSGFVDLSKSLLVGSIVAEAGWMGGGKPVAGYSTSSNGFDPGQGTLFLGLALRVQL